MIKIVNKERRVNGERWTIQRVGEDWHIKVAKETMHLRDEMLGRATKLHQRASDIDFDLLDFYCIKPPAIWFYPHIAYLISRLAPRLRVPLVIYIPDQPLNREDAKDWLMSISHPPSLLLAEPREGDASRLGWIDEDDTLSSAGWVVTERGARALALAVEQQYLHDFRFVYDETKSIQAARQDYIASQYHHPPNVVEPKSTKQYLEWYIAKVSNVMASIVKMDDALSRHVVSQTVNRIAIDLALIMTIEIPYLRKWYFFYLLDSLTSLEGLRRGLSAKQLRDKASSIWKEFLQDTFYHDRVKKALQQIPNHVIREHLQEHISAEYSKLTSALIDLLRTYRNTHHGYYLANEKAIKDVLAHSGEISNDLPDIAIGLWHYLLLDLIPNCKTRALFW